MPREVVLLGTKLAFVLFASIVILCVSLPSILIARRVTAIIVVHVFAFIVGSAINAVVIVGSHVSIGVCIIKPRFRLRFLSPRCILSGLRVGSGRVSRLRSARHSKNAE